MITFIKTRHCLFIFFFIAVSEIQSENVINNNDFNNFYITQYLNSRYDEDQRRVKTINNFSVNTCSEHTIHRLIIDFLKPLYQNNENFYLNSAENINLISKNKKDFIGSLENLLQLKTKAGRSALLLTMLYPSVSQEQIFHRQQLVQFFLENFNSTEMETLEGILQSLATNEHNFITTFENNFVATTKNFSLYSKFIEKNPSLYIVHYCGLSVIAWFCSLGLKLIPAIMYTYNYTTLQTIVSGILSWYGSLYVDMVNIVSIIGIAQKSKLIHDQLRHVSAYLNLIHPFARFSEHTLFLQDHPLFIQLQEAILSEKPLNELRHFLNDHTFSTDISFFHNWGKVFIAQQKVQQIDKNIIQSLLYFVGELDLAFSIAKLIKKNEINKKNQWCFAQFQTKSNEPFLSLKETWNPLLLHHKPLEQIICNNISLNDKHKNIILTGPNGCGKTAITTGVATTIITAQALGFAPASECILKPFAKVYVVFAPKSDSGNGESKFMAEINQIKQLIEGLEKLAFEEKFAFVVLDEIFTGTNPTDGEAAALEFLKHVVQKKLNRSFFMIISTHYRLLSEVTKEYPFCLNYKIDVIREKDGNIKKMFTWSPGISSMRVALDLFKENFC